jgi:hypothetical protein
MLIVRKTISMEKKLGTASDIKNNGQLAFPR